MILSAVVLVGPIQRLGYQYHAQLTLENFVTYFDKVYVISSSRETRQLPVQSDKIRFVSDERSWFELDAEGREAFDFHKLVENWMRMIRKAAEAGDDFILNIDINEYIDAENFQKLLAYCQQLQDENEPYGYRYRAYQILDQITYPNVRKPWLLNLKHADFPQIQMYPDAIYYKGEKFLAERGIFTEAPYYITDIFPSALTERDFDEKYEYYIKYVQEEWYPGYPKLDNWEFYVEIHKSKVNKEVLNLKAVLSEWGVRVIENFPQETIFSEIDINLSQLGFMLTKDSMQHLRQQGLPKDLITMLKSLKNQKFNEKEEFLKAIERKIDKQQINLYQTQILESAASVF